MFKLLKTSNTFGIRLFWIFKIEIGYNKGVLVNTISIIIDVWKFTTALYIGKESKDGTKSKQQLKESKDTYASA